MTPTRLRQHWVVIGAVIGLVAMFLLGIGGLLFRAIRSAPEAPRGLFTSEADPVHPCDRTAPFPATPGPGPFAVGFCSEHPEIAGLVATIDGKELPEGPGLRRVSAEPNAGGQFYYETPAVFVLTPGRHTLAAKVRARKDDEDFWSDVSMPSAITVAGDPVVAPVIDPCGPVGADAVAIFVTRWELTNKQPGSRIRVNYTATSASPVVAVQAKVDGRVVAQLEGGDLADGGGLWMDQPAPGRHKLTVWARNAKGCTREAYAPIDLVIQ